MYSGMLPESFDTKPDGPYACLQILPNLEHKVVRLVILGDNFNNEIGRNRQGYLVKIDIFDPIATEEHQIRSANRVFAKPYVNLINDLSKIVFVSPPTQSSV